MRLIGLVEILEEFRDILLIEMKYVGCILLLRMHQKEQQIMKGASQPTGCTLRVYS